ncbi:DUF5675 family protein [Desulfovibrio sp. OttesenSCG-928-C06]|nr:DUF5675 family protein [Desulfovibrio sp. OttesenSCG-928-C06]
MSNPRFTLTRAASSDHGTAGFLSGLGGFKIATLELPWRDNRQYFSCIPAGDYLCRPYSSPHRADGRPGKYQNVYQVLDVPGRSAILIHAGNWAGDVKLGYKTDVQGCILVGTRHMYPSGKGQLMLSESRIALQMLRDCLAVLGATRFVLSIRTAEGSAA